MADNNPFPGWDSTNPTESIKKLYDWTVTETQNRIGWYIRHSKAKKFGSQWIRVFVIIFSAIGGLCPLIATTGLLTQKEFQQIGQWGYVFFAMAAAIFLFDKFFGLSNGWMRFIVTQLSLERLMKEFEYDWVNLNIQSVGIQTLADRLKKFGLDVENLVKQETDAWVTEFQNDINALQSLLKTQTDKIQSQSSPATDQAAPTKII